MVAAAGESDIVERDLDVGILPVPEAGIFGIAYGRAVNDSSERYVVATPAKRGAGCEILVVRVYLYFRSLAVTMVFSVVSDVQVCVESMAVSLTTL